MSDRSPDDDAVGAELRRLFDDDRLDVRPVAGAGDAIVAGARRRRRRRAAVASGGGTLAVLVLVGGGLALTTLRGGDDQPQPPVAAMPQTTTTTSALGSPSASSASPERSEPTLGESQAPPSPEQQSPQSPPTRSSTSAASTSASVYIDRPMLRPDGYRQLTLGMSYQEAAATGLLGPAESTTPPAENACATYAVTDGTNAIDDVTISRANGIVRFRAADAATPQGIGAGSSLDQLRSAYSDLAVESNGYSASASAGARYSFVVATETVTELQLVARDSDC
ncbi:hypothetical protein [Prauserella endophytica]|uniref:Uncharacterized protein n=1 Tax=Prauserella endophytica TaxID=1592324 RepID=A0ABY2SCZ0_9PSEU|nr:hypothetical protein [Prauserella endophytica]PXY34894.1 hypothetical protein BAY59_05260 [Prauserella coralliicola]TKG73421.1 hypothetical protein FCN18_02295 [Prauserella endophytica]